MCYSYNKDVRQDVKKDDSKDREARQQPRAAAPDFKFWAFPRRGKKPAAEDPAASVRTREKV
ncbi:MULTISPECIES: hypothetical protein [unclassified Arthrobacter]|uniref:hypothetical protein n=1 Tax=unclassified Arthrobacter TaxID=235627 RepID=UPI002DFE0300|nr:MULTISPECIES: hypothetical protein [unclassified Arthrobacter]MEC5190035.1 hypothetical protein [Arthrobacter sp. MP_M4]MEC5201503.1 hypothetical protein [Arthrobacter sp. MP_M7]